MRHHYRWVAIAATLFATSFACAQQAPSSANPLARNSTHSFFDGSFIDGGLRPGPLDARNGIARPPAQFHPVTPVPEPSEWLMMLAGLGVVGYIARRGSQRS